MLVANVIRRTAKGTFRKDNIFNTNRNTMQWTSLLSWNLIELLGLLEDELRIEECPGFNHVIPLLDSSEERSGVSLDCKFA